MTSFPKFSLETSHLAKAPSLRREELFILSAYGFLSQVPWKLQELQRRQKATPLRWQRVRFYLSEKPFQSARPPDRRLKSPTFISPS